ncbi:ATP-binding protein [Streptomyces sp. NPDC001410]|uniref:ATP-binding protein n=1 Tax=Streptomyces sp. NPDC001410 TaxID=3364574 RepID=UPI003673665D
MTTNLADQERTRRRAPGTAPEPRRYGDARTALEMSIERRPDPDSGDLSEADAAWPQRLRRIVRAGLTYWGRPDLIETAELLLTELATNALRHGSGPDISVRVYIKDDRCVIEVNDGSPIRPELRHADPTDEGGRGLFLVESLAAEWGVSPDGTTTWCTLPLTEGPSDMEPAALTAPVLREVPLSLPAGPTAVSAARIEGRTLLTVLDWPGNVHAAIDVLHCLVDNAVAYGLAPGNTGESLGVRLRVTEAHELLIDVTDPNPTFPNFPEAVDGTEGRGLWNARQLGARLSWFVASDFEGKTVRATMNPGQVVQ